MRLKRVLAVVLVVVLVVVGVGIGALAWVTGRALPQTSGTLTVPGLERPVTVVRDVAGIAHIRAETAHDLFMAQGFVHAQERMWQMEVWRHISAGRLSEMFGESQLDTDRFIRTLGWRQATERDLAAMAPEARAVVDAYARGRQRLARPGTGQPRARVPRDGHEAGTVDGARFGRLAEGPGVEPRQQHGRGAVPVPRRRPPRRPGPHRRAVPALSGRRTGDRAGPGRRGGRGGRTAAIRRTVARRPKRRQPAGARSPTSATRSDASRAWISATAWSACTAWARTTGSSRRA